MNFRSTVIVFFIIFIFKGLFSITPPIICERQSPFDSAEVNISCDRFELSELNFYRAKIVDGSYTDFRENVPAEDDCVLPGEYMYILDVPCPECGSGGYSSCRNYLEVSVRDHTNICENSGVAADIDSDEFNSYKSDWDYYEDCCESELSAERLEIYFGKVEIGTESETQTIEFSVYSCSNAPNDLTPSFSFKNEDQSAFNVEVGETNYSYIPSGSGEAEFLFSFSPEEEAEYNETVVFDFDSIKLEVTLKGEGVNKNIDETPDEQSDNETAPDNSNSETEDVTTKPDNNEIKDESEADQSDDETVEKSSSGACSISII